MAMEVLDIEEVPKSARSKGRTPTSVAWQMIQRAKQGVYKKIKVTAETPDESKAFYRSLTQWRYRNPGEIGISKDGLNVYIWVLDEDESKRDIARAEKSGRKAPR